MLKAAQDRMLISHLPLLPEGEATCGGAPRHLESRDRQSHKRPREGIQGRGRYRKADGVLHLESLSHPFISIWASPDRWSCTIEGRDLAHETSTPWCAPFRNIVGFRYPVTPCFNWSGQGDSNSRPSAPKADALPDCAMPRTVPTRGEKPLAARHDMREYPPIGRVRVQAVHDGTGD